MAASLLTLRTLDGDVAELHVEPAEHIYRVAQRLAELKKPGEKVFARLVHEGQPLPPGSKVGDHDLAEVDAVWCKWTPPEKFGNSSNEVLPRRQLNVKELHADSGRLDISGTFTKPGYDRLQLAIDLPTAAFGLGLRVLDLRQCGLAPESLLTIFEKLPSSLEELWASRNHFSLRVLQCLQQKALQLRALDVGYSECDICTPLPDLVCEKTEELILGDLNDLLPETFAATLAKCPFLRSLDICSCWRLLGSFGAIAALPELRRLKSQRVDVDEEGVNQVLRSCTQLEHLYLERVSSSGSIQLLAKLENLKVFAGQVATGDLGNQLICEICQLKVETLLICPGLMAEDEDEPSTALSENVGPLVQALKNCVAGCIAVEASSVDPAVLEAVGCRLCRMDNGLSSGSFSLISSLLEMKHCCTNLLSLSVNYWEQIDGKQFAQLVAACPLLQIVHLNADDCGFQISPIDEGILALGQHCHQLEHLDMYDRIMKEPAKTLIQATEGWPLLNYLCMANCVRVDSSWLEVEEIGVLPEVLARNCPKLQEFVVYDDDMRALFEPVLDRECCLYGNLLDYDETEYEDEE